ncbi:MAG: hypothetical protein GY765_29345, partial [bacterium]|nr:hypothetical protein [bacterium]
MEERLKSIFANVNDWLKFAEAKNAALVAFNSAIIFAVLSVFDQAALQKFPIGKWFLIPFLILTALGLGIALWTF